MHHSLPKVGAARKSVAEPADENTEASRYFNNLGNAFIDQGKLDDALGCFHKAVACNPDFTEAYNNLGNIYKIKFDFNNAVLFYQKALRSNPRYSEAYYNLGILFNEYGKFDDAMQCYRRAISHNPRFVEAFFNLGNTCRKLGKMEEAMQCYCMALEINPDYVQAYNGLATIYQEQGQLNKAYSCYQKHERIKADAGIEVKASLLLPVVCESTQSISAYRTAFSKNIEKLSHRGLRLKDPSGQIGETSFYLAYHGLNNRQLQEKIAAFYLNACPDLAWHAPLKPSSGRIDGKVAIGIISQHLRSHTIGYLNYGLIEHLDREKFHVTVFAFPGMKDKLTANIAHAADQTVSLPSRLPQARQIIAQQPQDILLYPDIGMDPLTYFLAFSRLAPVQCTTWGHPDTTGVPNMDYYISSAAAEPPGAQAHYTEKLILFDQFPMYCRRPDAPGRQLTRRHLNLPEDVHLYACIQSLFKIHPDFDDILAGILRRDPAGIILFFEGKHTHWGDLLRQRFGRQIPDVCNRIRFLKRLPPEDFMAFLQIPDVLLDTIHFSGGYTSLLAFSSGTPIVTWPGAFMRGRLTYSFYAQMDVLDTVVDSPEAYIQIACKLANDRHRNEELRARIKRRAGCLYDNPAPVYELENFFRWASRQAKGNRN